MRKFEKRCLCMTETLLIFRKPIKAYIATLNEEEATEENSTYYQSKWEEYQQFSKAMSEWIKGREVDIKPQDSISQVSSKGSKNSKASSVRTVASTERMKEEAKLEGLKVRVEMLRKRREIEEKERLLKQQREDYELEVEMKLAEAKANVFKKYDNPESSDEESLLTKSDDKVDSSGVHNLIRSQTEISRMMIDQQKLVSLPRRELQIFDGKVQDYRAFIAAFEHNIEQLTDNNQDRLYYLQQFTSGRPRELVRSCMGKDPKRGYEQARRELEEEYGDDFRILSSYRKEIEMMQPIKGENSAAMKDYLTFCVVFGNAINESEILRKLDQTESIMKLVSKLPYRLRERWRLQAYRIKGKSHKLAGFHDYVEFVREQVKIATDSIYGDISMESSKDCSKFRQNRKSFKGFSTIIQEQKSRSKNEGKSLEYTKCLYCGNNHMLEVCRELGSKTHEEKLIFLRTKGLCFRCLDGNHISKDCKQDRLICKVCRKLHPTVLHYGKQPERKPTSQLGDCLNQAPRETTTTVKTSCVNTQPGTSICMGAGVNKTSMPVVPVRVKSKSTNKDVETYAFLDTGSSDTFISENLAKQLCVSGPKTKILLSTLPNDGLVDSRFVVNLEVCDLQGLNSLPLPTVYIQKRIPVNKEDIVTQDDLRKWPYLRRVSIPDSKATEVGLLIGQNAHKSLEPWEVVNSQGDGPYAVRTCLGWTVNGPIKSGMKVHVNYVSLRTIDEREHRDLLRFVWWPDGNTDQPLREYKMMVHLFGAVSSPSCANYALHKTADDFGDGFDKRTVEAVKENFYVDDMLKSVGTEEEAIILMKQLRELLGRGGFRLTKWVSNSRLVLDTIPKSERAEGIRSLDMEKDKLPIDRALGVSWCVESDQFQFRVTVNERPYTRKGILSIVASIYDPLGFLAPFVLVAKRILQDLCRMKLAWDDDIPDEHLKCWKRWLLELPKLKDFKVNRCRKSDGYDNVRNTQLHLFSDASESGYGVAAYVRFVNEENQIHCAFVMGKARVAPLKQITIPRLELTAATVSVRLFKSLERDLHIKLDSVTFWTDSTSVIRYVSNSSARYHTFVANRVAIITDTSQPSQWSYVESSENPADDASRGLYADDLIRCHRWILGPDFLWLHENEWPLRQKFERDISLKDPEVKKTATVAATSTNVAQNTMNELISKYSSWFKLKCHIAWMLKLMSVLKQLSDLRKSLKGQEPMEIDEKMRHARQRRYKMNLSVSDLEEAEVSVVKFVQNQAFPDEIASLRDNSKGGSVKKRSPIYKLDPRYKDGVLRVGGRLSRSAMPECEKHQYILPKKSIVSEMIMREIHTQLYHGGRAMTLSHLRRKYWVVSAHALVRKCINQCVTCRRLRAKAGEQKMADLPTSRITPDEPPFTRVGVDFFGPFNVKQGRSLVKRYGVVFTCFAIRAVHLEVAHALDTDSCINALRRFIARRGQVGEIWSDNGTNLVATDRELKRSIQEWNDSKIRSEMLQVNVDWKYSPPTGSHYGGVWERQIRTVRQILNVLLRSQTLSDESLQTFLCEVEATINSRPLTTVSLDLNDVEPLTPNHLLLLKGKPNLPPGVFVKTDVYVRRRWRQAQFLADLFWKRWLREYLPQLQQRQKWLKPKRNFEPGDIVLIVEDNAPRNSWLMGRITSVLSDQRGEVRRVKVKTASSELERPIAKLCLLLEADE
ncbi:uncharacterized protein [Apostichopus japonicus]|uniref:uncharacterized protein n=1 Tax=Stichopus japonicus TaxID=307972 RepID=UPI003AB8F94C